MKWIIMSSYKAFFSVTKPLHYKPHSSIYLILETFICQVTRCGFMFDMLALMFLLPSDCLALSVFLYVKTCKHELAVLYLQELHFFGGLNELLLKLGGFLHRLSLGLLKSAGEL